MSLLIPADYRRVPGKWKAPAWFVNRMHDIDPALEVFFNVNRQRWIIIRNAQGTQTHVKTLENLNGSYAPPDEAALIWLKQSDMWGNNKSLEQLASDLNYQEHMQRESIARSIRNDFHDAAMDDKLQIKRALGDATVFPSIKPSDSEQSDASGGN